MASQRLDCAQDLIRLLGIQQKILIFSERILQAETLYKLLENQYPGKIGRYHSKMGPQANKNALERFRLGDIRILIACKAIDEGVDIPDAAVGIILSGTSVQRQRIQRLGRIIRKKEGKEQALLYYLHVTAAKPVKDTAKKGLSFTQEKYKNQRLWQAELFKIILRFCEHTNQEV